MEIPDEILGLNLSPHSLAMYCHIKKEIDSSGICELSTKDLAARCNMSAGKVSWCKRELENARLISVETQDDRRHIIYPYEEGVSRTRAIRGFVYLIACGVYYKIGVSKTPNERIVRLSTLPPFDVKLVCLLKTGDMYSLEKQLHDKFADKRVNGEWFLLSSSDIEYVVAMSDTIAGDTLWAR